MKKILFMAAAGLTLLGSCSSEETIDTLKGGAIEFDNPFVNKAGRGEVLTVTDDIENCKVWGSSSAANAFIFDGTVLNVSGSQSLATYSPMQYWTASSQYYFMSIASNSETPCWKYTRPVDIPTAGPYGTLEMDVASANGDEDVVFASAYREVKAEIGNQNVVQLSFKHALSRIRFGFTNNIADNYKIEVSNVRISGLYSKGTLDFSGGTGLVWTGTAPAVGQQSLVHTLKNAQAEYNLEVTTDYKFVIPNSSATFTVDFDLDLYVKVNEEYVKVNAGSYHHTVKLDSQEFLMNNAYKFNAMIGKDNIDPDNPMTPIQFMADVEPWTDGRVETITIPDPQPANP